jgi:hypothetical protein
MTEMPTPIRALGDAPTFTTQGTRKRCQGQSVVDVPSLRTHHVDDLELPPAPSTKSERPEFSWGRTNQHHRSQRVDLAALASPTVRHLQRYSPRRVGEKYRLRDRITASEGATRSRRLATPASHARRFGRIHDGLRHYIEAIASTS